MARKPTLAQARKRKLMSTSRLAREAGVAITTILDIERGIVARPRLETIEKLSRALGVDPFEIDWPGNPLGADDEEGGDHETG